MSLTSATFLRTQLNHLSPSTQIKWKSYRITQSGLNLMPQAIKARQASDMTYYKISYNMVFENSLIVATTWFISRILAALNTPDS